MVRLGVNIDHIATVRQARGEEFPDPLRAAEAALEGGAEGITAHLREDRRHIQDKDILRFKVGLSVPLNMEMACVPEIIAIAEKVKPAWVCLVPEKRKELTTEGGLDVKGDSGVIKSAVERLKAAGIRVSLFIEPRLDAVKISKDIGADAVELHTGAFAKFYRSKDFSLGSELDRIGTAAREAKDLRLIVNAGHGIDYDNVGRLLTVFPFNELNIGFAIIARSLFVGMTAAVKEMKLKMEP